MYACETIPLTIPPCEPLSAAHPRLCSEPHPNIGPRNLTYAAAAAREARQRHSLHPTPCDPTIRWGRRCRYFDFMEEHLRNHHGHSVPAAQRDRLSRAALSLDVMPSMRALMTAGPALRNSGIAAYNCSYLPIDAPEAFHEILYILMHGTGVGFSVERQFTGAAPHPNTTAVARWSSISPWRAVGMELRCCVAGQARPICMHAELAWRHALG